MWDNSKYRCYTMKQLLKHTVLWPFGLSGSVQESFGVGACPAVAGAVNSQSAQFINCCQLFLGSRGGSRAALPPCAPPSGKERLGGSRPARSPGAAAALRLPEARRASGSIKQAFWCLRGRRQLCLERQKSANPL